MKSSNVGIPAGAVLAVPPLVLLAVAIYFRSILDDFPGDPDYAYLLNGLNILQLRPPTHTDHPGTTVQLLAGLISGIVWLVRAPFNDWLRPVDDVLLHPESYLVVISLVFNTLSSAALFVLGWRIFRRTGSLLSAAVAQISIFLSLPALYVGLTHVAPEGLLLPLILFLAAAMVPAAFASASPAPWKTGAIVGALIGACLATKTSALPLVFSILIFRERRIQVAAAASAVLAGFVCTLPVAGKYGGIIGYNWRMLTHIGPWGTGAQGVLPSQYWTTLRDLYSTVPEVYLSFTLCLALALLIRIGAIRSEKFALTRLFVVLAVVMAAQIAMVAKQGQVHYLVPVAATVCLANAAACFLLLQGGITRRASGLILVLALVAHGLWHGGRDALRVAHANGAQRRDNNAVQDRLAAADCKIVYAYENQTIPYKLFFGDHFADANYISSLHRLYPNVIFYNEPKRLFDTAEGILDSAQANEWVGRQKCVYLVASPMERFTPESFGISPDYLTLIDRSQQGMASVAIYRIRSPAPGESIFVARH